MPPDTTLPKQKGKEELLEKEVSLLEKEDASRLGHHHHHGNRHGTILQCTPPPRHPPTMAEKDLVKEPKPFSQKQQRRHKGRSRHQIMADMLNNVLGRGDLPNKATRTV